MHEIIEEIDENSLTLANFNYCDHCMNMTYVFETSVMLQVQAVSYVLNVMLCHSVTDCYMVMCLWASDTLNTCFVCGHLIMKKRQYVCDIVILLPFCLKHVINEEYAYIACLPCFVACYLVSLGRILTACCGIVQNNSNIIL